MFIANRGETKELNESTRKPAEGSFIPLLNGVTHYELSNPNQQETVVLVHGFSTPYFIFDPLFKFLSASGFRVLRYDLYGRGYSDRPHTRYNIDLFISQLAELLDALRLSLPINLLGLSMGGPITATFTTRYPERVKSLTLVDPAGVRAVSVSPLQRIVQLPFVAETILGVVGSELFVKTAAKDFFDPKLVNHFIEQYRVQLEFKGYRRAILSTVRNGMLNAFIETYKTLGTMALPIALFWGRNDKTVPFEYSTDLRNVLPLAEFHAIADAGHVSFYEQPDVFNSLLLKFLRKNVPQAT